VVVPIVGIIFGFIGVVLAISRNELIIRIPPNVYKEFTKDSYLAPTHPSEHKAPSYGCLFLLWLFLALFGVIGDFLNFNLGPTYICFLMFILPMFLTVRFFWGLFAWFTEQTPTRPTEDEKK
jgi:hypothetical protein